MTQPYIPATEVSSLSSLSLASVLDQSVDCVKLISLDGRVQYMNPNGLCAMEIDDFGPVKGSVWTDLWPAAARQQINDSYPAASKGQTVRFRAFCPTSKGSPRWWDVTVSPLTGADGALASYLAVSRDVTENQQSREALTIATAELKHRLKNTYQLVASLTLGMARGNVAHEAFAHDMANRLGTLSRAQLLFTDEDAPCDLDKLIPALVTPFGNSVGQISIDALPAIYVEQSRADAIALVVGELAVNSAKHGAFAHGGKVHVSARTEHHQLEVIWRERCDQPITRQAREGGQGLRLMDRIMRARGGSLAVEWDDGGVAVTLVFPLAA